MMITQNVLNSRSWFQKLSNLVFLTFRFEDFEKNLYYVNAINMFRYGIKPAWEDEMNGKGSDLKVDFGSLRDVEYIQKIW